MCSTIVHNTAQNSANNLPLFLHHHCSDILSTGGEGAWVDNCDAIAKCVSLLKCCLRRAVKITTTQQNSNASKTARGCPHSYLPLLYPS